jgi:hypothetical protein
MRCLQSQRLRELLHYGVVFLASSWVPVVDHRPSAALGLIFLLGPAHAVYFATYEAVKQAMGGNEGTEHHPLAAGNIFILRTIMAIS